VGMKTSDWIAAAAAFGTWSAVVVALWGEWIRSWFRFLRPELDIELIGLDRIVPLENGKNARFYRIRVRNRRFHQLVVAHQVRLLIMRVEKPGAGGQPVNDYTGPLPLMWVGQELLPLALDIGPDKDATLLYVQEDGLFSFTPLVFPYHFPPAKIGEAHFWVTLQAQALEAVSDLRRYKIDWNGKWDPGESEIAHNLVVTPTHDNEIRHLRSA
jgi:hypothetical protein